MKPLERKSQIEESTISVREVLRYLAEDRYLSRQQAAEYTGLSIRVLDEAEDLPRYRPVAGRTVLLKSDIDRWMQAHREGADTELLAEHMIRGLKRKMSQE